MTQSDEEEDYMTMVFEDVPKPKHETSLQRAARKRREGEERSRPKPKVEREAEAEVALEDAMSTALPTGNKGFKMMAKYGFKQGDALGKSEGARKEPITVTQKLDKGGIGVESEKKRKIREHYEQVERQTKRLKEGELDFREAQRQEIKEKKNEKDFYNAQRTAEQLHEKELEKEFGGNVSINIPLKDVNVLWRGLVKHRREKEQKKKESHDLNNSLLGRLPTFHDDEEDSDDKLALGGLTTNAFDEVEHEDNDPELEAFEAEPFADRLDQIILFLRENYHYCFWCAYQYPDAAMDGCPGITEGEHD